VLAIQKQFVQLRRFHVRYGMIVGLAWWLVWIPLVMMFFMGAFGADLYANAPAVIYAGTAVGIAGLLATAWLHRWSHRPERAQLGRRLDDSVTGGSIRRAQAALEEINRFEQD
jgi:serine/threonine-protein kinase